MKTISKLLAISLLLSGALVQSECVDGVCTVDFNKNKHNTAQTRALSAQSDEQGAVRELTADDFEDFIKQSKKPVIVDFYATWCQPCAEMKPLFAALAEQEKNYIFASIDIDKAQDIAMDYSVEALPSFVVFKNGTQWGMVQGAMTKKKLLAELKKVVATTKPADLTVVPKGLVKLIMAICSKDLALVERLINKNVDVNGVYTVMMFGSTTPLQVAITGSSEEIIDTLITAGAKFSDALEKSIREQVQKNQKMYDEIGQTLAYAKEKIAAAPARATLMIYKENDPKIAQAVAGCLGSPFTLRQFVKAGTNFNNFFELNGKQITPIYLAVLTNNLAAIDILVEGGASFDALVTDSAGQTTTIGNVIEQDCGSSVQTNILARLEYVKSKMTTIVRK